MIALTRPLILTVLRLITGAIEGVAKLIFIIIDKLHLKFAAFYLLVGLIVWLAGGMPRGGWFMTAYLIGLALVALSWLYRFFRVPLKFLKGKEKTKKSASGSEVQIVAPPPATESQPAVTPPPREERAVATENPVRPKYYRVRQNPRYIMAEYPDRYELFYERGAGDWKYIRTDFKNYGDNHR